jgi:hypothetical protein
MEFLSASQCAHVRACIAQFVADGVEDNCVVDNSWWESSIDKHTDKLFNADREPALRDILNHCYSAESAPVVPGFNVRLLPYSFFLLTLSLLAHAR